MNFPFTLEYPMVLIIIFPLFLLLLLLLKHEFLKLDMDDRMKKRLKTYRLIMLFFRTILFILLVGALASPFRVVEEIVQGDPYLSILIDNTSSYSVFPKNTNLINSLEEKILVDKSYVNPHDYSAIGDAILSAARESDNILLISDGQNNYGTDLGDVTLFLATENITLHTLENEPREKDFSISIEGPTETVADVENVFYINMNKDPDETIHLIVYIDGKLKMEKYTTNDREVFSHVFSSGTHEIEAKIKDPPSENYFTNNDIYYKTVHVIKKPQIALVTDSDTPISRLLNSFYEITQTTSIPSNLEPYYAVVMNDINANDISTEQVDRLEEYLNDGNGLMVLGGENSFDYGDYRGDYFETILPTQAGEGKQLDESKEKVNIVFVIDISYGSYGNDEGIAVEKAHAVNILRSLRSTDRIGALAFNQDVFVISDMVEYDTRKELIASNIQKLPFGGNSRMGPAILYAVDMLKDLEGSNNIIVLSDGWTDNCNSDRSWQYDLPGASCKTEDDLVYVSNIAADRGIKIFSLGVPQDRSKEPIKEPLMKKIASITGGVYELASKATNVILEFGSEKEKPEEEKVSLKSLFVRDSDHFITNGLKLSQTDIGGFNTIVPKSIAQTLVTTSQGYPIVTTWRYGLGRVISFTTDDGSKWAGGLLSKENSKIIIRSVAYAVGNPKRKEKYYVEIPDSEVDRDSIVTVKSETFPESDELKFNMVEPDIYIASFIPSNTSFNSLMGREFAVNYQNEYQDIGFNDMLRSYVLQTGGRTFLPNDEEGIILQAKSNAKKLISKRVYFRWVLLLAALIVFLIELTVRRIFSNRRKI